MPRSKYNSRPTIIDGIRFDSKAEAARYVELRLLERAGQLTGLELHPSYLLQSKYTTRAGENVRAITYVADFRYTETATGRMIVEDVKGKATDVYKIKKKILLWRYPGINFIES